MRDTGGPRVNEEIHARRVQLVDTEGKRLGEFMTPDAIQYAKDHGMDLIEVGASESPPICRVGDWGRIKYQREKAQAVQRKKQRSGALKEVKVRPKTDDHDIEVKVRNAARFLDRGDRVKITVWFRGREHAHHDIGAEQCMRIFEGVGDLATIESQPHMEGRRMHMILAPTSKERVA
jgi:translation initiation factor IF-3